MFDESGKGNLEERDLFKSSRYSRNVHSAVDDQFPSCVSKGRAAMIWRGTLLHATVERKLMTHFLNTTLFLCSLDIPLSCESRVPLQHW